MNFVMSYSGGKDSALALYEMMQAGHHCVGLLVMMNKDMNRSWFHGIDPQLMSDIASSLGLALFLGISDGSDYQEVMEEVLSKIDAQACVFGDIDIEAHRTWSRERAQHANMEAIFPLWLRSRREIVETNIKHGFQSMVKCIHNDLLPETYLGKFLSERMIDEFEAIGIDCCGENGEYHTVCVDGPCFKYPVPYHLKECLTFKNISVIDIQGGSK